MKENIRSPSVVSIDNQKISCKTDITRQNIPLLKKSLQQSIQYFKKLKLNRFVVPSWYTLDQALKTYYNEYLKLFQENKKLNREFFQLIEVKNDLAKQLLQKKKIDYREKDKIKRQRRYAFQIRRDFDCPIQQCQKKYGLQGSLTQHMKLKHEQYYRSGEYDQYLKQIFQNMKKQEQLI